MRPSRFRPARLDAMLDGLPLLRVQGIKIGGDHRRQDSNKADRYRGSFPFCSQIDSGYSWGLAAAAESFDRRVSGSHISIMTAHVSIPLRGEQTDLFGARALGPEGFRYQPDLITAAEEADLVGHLAQLPFEPFDFHGHLANRQVVGFGYRYDYASRTVRTCAGNPRLPAAPSPKDCSLHRTGRRGVPAGADQ